MERKASLDLVIKNKTTQPVNRLYKQNKILSGCLKVWSGTFLSSLENLEKGVMYYSYITQNCHVNCFCVKNDLKNKEICCNRENIHTSPPPIPPPLWKFQFHPRLPAFALSHPIPPLKFPITHHGVGVDIFMETTQSKTCNIPRLWQSSWKQRNFL